MPATRTPTTTSAWRSTTWPTAAVTGARCSGAPTGATRRPGSCWSRRGDDPDPVRPRSGHRPVRGQVVRERLDVQLARHPVHAPGEHAEPGPARGEQVVDGDP